jgi:hypothetical protein
MKPWLILCLTLFTTSSWALSGKEIWQNSNIKSRVSLLQEYKAFYQELTALESQNYEELLEKSSYFSFFMSEAWAAPEPNCIYAGWPSQRMGKFCSSPQRQNPDYEKGSCSNSELQCQPLLFGKGHCVPVSTRSQRQLAFSNCNKKFEASKKKPEEVVAEIRSLGKEAELFELMDFAEKICKEGAQAKTPMCRRLEASIQSLRAFAKKPEEKPEKSEPSVTIEGSKVTDPVIKSEIVRSVEVTNKVVQRKIAVIEVEDCPPEEAVPFERDIPRPVDFDYITSRQGQDPAWEDKFIADKKDGLRYTGFELNNAGPNDIAGDPLDPQERVVREWEFVSFDNSKRETYLWVTDDAGSGKLSQLMESVILIIPRKMKPKAEIVDEDVHVTLTTGEKIIYDRNTRKVKGGVFTERAVDLNPNRFNRKFAPVNYTGKGISIRINRRGEDPRLIQGHAEVKQNGLTCKVAIQELWNGTEFKYADDSKLVELLNKKCGKKFKI